MQYVPLHGAIWFPIEPMTLPSLKSGRQHRAYLLNFRKTNLRAPYERLKQLRHSRDLGLCRLETGPAGIAYTACNFPYECHHELSVERMPTSQDTTFLRQTQVCIVTPQRHPVLRARGEHSVYRT